MRIVIPTYKREEKQTCYRRMPEWVRFNTTLFTHDGRADLLRKQWPDADVVDLGHCNGMYDVRQRIYDYMKAEGETKYLQLDDHVYFYKREIPHKGSKLISLTEDDDWERMLNKVEEDLDRHAWVGISERAGNNRYEGTHHYATRSQSAFGTSIPLTEELGLRFDALWMLDPLVKSLSDYQMILNMLVQGHANVVRYDYCAQTSHGLPGGCNTYRTNEHRKYCADVLAAIYPDFVKVRKRPCKVQTMDGAGDWRWDVLISWKKAYEYGLSKKP